MVDARSDSLMSCRDDHSGGTSDWSEAVIVELTSDSSKLESSASEIFEDDEVCSSTDGESSPVQITWDESVGVGSAT